ncbi:hypothetical protein L1049_013153 [Liquidambar formosana]|uniref:FAS1 domain-containing protein n=1 Tax=Liquidambar formosana TaxID=63359 RepID=A0AAP0WTV1_LIQFO
MMKQLLFSITLLLIFLFHCPTTLAQSPAQAPAPPASTRSITKILKKAGKFSFLIRLLKSTQVDIRITTQLKRSKQGLTLFAPTDSAFSSLKAGVLNSLSDQQQDQLVLFHVIPVYLSTSQFPAVINPLRTLAGASSIDQFPLNVSTSGDQVSLSTGLVDTTLADTIYSDNQLIVYEVDKVLLPMSIFGTAPAPAPVAPPSKPEKEIPAENVKSSSFDSRGGIMLSIAVAVIAAFSL